MTAAFILQDGVPLEPIRRRPRQPFQPWKDAVSKAEVGQFFFAPGRAPRSVSSYMARVSKGTGRKFQTRPVWAWFDRAQQKWLLVEAGTEGAQEGVGIWRVE